jgi:hypothetical protein
MTDTIRKQIMDAFETRLKGILVTGGYATNLGANVKAWRTTDFQPDELPALSFKDTKNDRSSYSQLEYTNMLTIEMEIHPAPGVNTIPDAYTLIADVYKAIAVDDRWGGLAEDTTPVDDVIEASQHDRIVGKITLTVRVEYTSSKWSF